MVEISGGRALEKELAKLSKQVSTAASVEIGFMENATYDDGTPVAMVAAIQEFGAPHAGIPPRPFFRTAVKKNSPKWGPSISALLVRSNFDAKATLSSIGMSIEGEISESIAEWEAPPLSPVTLMLRKMRKDNPSLVVTGKTVGEAAAKVAKGESTGGVSTKPLVYTGTMLRSVTSVVK